MSDAETLRRAAKLMRERAEAAHPSPWKKHRHVPGTIYTARGGYPTSVPYDADATHIASWHPAVALSVAGWLDDVATRHAPSADTLELMLHYDSDEPCEACEDGSGHECVVCEGCFPSWDGMESHTVYPCRETRSALAVARAYLGETP